MKKKREEEITNLMSGLLKAALLAQDILLPSRYFHPAPTLCLLRTHTTPKAAHAEIHTKD